MLVTCPNCGAKNRTDPAKAAGGQPVCGRCRRPLPVTAAASGPQVVSDADFDAFLASAGDRPVLVDFWATWCPPCRMLAPIIDELAREAGERYLVGKLDTDHNPATAGRYGISALPTVVIFRNGQVVDRLVGLQSKQAITAKLGL